MFEKKPKLQLEVSHTLADGRVISDDVWMKGVTFDYEKNKDVLDDVARMDKAFVAYERALHRMAKTEQRRAELYAEQARITRELQAL